MICPECGIDNSEESACCAGCGSALTGGATIAPPTSDPAGVAGDRTVEFPGTPPVAGDKRPAVGGTGAWSMSPSADVLGPVPGTLAVGSVLADRYEIVKMLGEGGMGAVYRAQDRELDRPVALKVIRPELATQPTILRRFKQEIILAREVTHPNVVRIFDLGTSDGIKFITMEFVEGQDLK
jgi:hypothetical protein